MTVVSLFSVRELGSAPDFDAFWSSYPRKVAKKDARKAWAKLTPADQADAISGLPTYVTYLRACGTLPQYILHPATWLNGARWEDELEMPRARQRPESGPPWWSSHGLMERKGRDVGVGPARAGETTEQYRARIQSAIDDAARFGGQP